MKIAIIDSGLDKKFINEKKIVGGCTFKYSVDKIICVNDEYFDDNGHGTATYQIIEQNGSEKNLYYIIKILDKNNETSTEILIHALKHLLEISVDIIHLSLAIEKQSFSGMLQLKRICRKLVKNNRFIVCAQRNKTNIPSYPAAYSSVLGVDGIYTKELNEIWYNIDKKIQCYANAVSKLVKTIDDGYMFFGGTSKSAAMITGILSIYSAFDYRQSYL